MTKNEVSKKIKLAMIEAGVNQKILGEKLGLTHQAISRWVSGASNPSLKSLKKIADATGKPLSYFINNNESMGNNSVNLAGHQKINGAIHYEIQKSIEQYHEILGILKEMQFFNEKLKSLETLNLKLDLILERLKK